MLAETTHDVAAPRDGFTCVVTPATYYSKSVRSFGAAGEGRNLAIPITLAVGFYNSLYYRTSRDNSKTIKQNREKIAPIAF